MPFDNLVPVRLFIQDCLDVALLSNFSICNNGVETREIDCDIAAIDLGIYE
jgi:hypothetical protein